MSSLERQQAAFASDMSAAAAKLTGGRKRALAPPSPSPSVGSTASAAPAGGTTPRKDRDTPAASGHNIVYSQPAMTGTGESVIAQMAYAVSWLRTKEEPQTYLDVLGYLSGTGRPENEQEYFVEQMRRHPQIQWNPDPNLSEQTWRSGTYVHRPVIPNVKSKTQLLAYLQKKNGCERGGGQGSEGRVALLRWAADGARGRAQDSGDPGQEGRCCEDGVAG